MAVCVRCEEEIEYGLCSNCDDTDTLRATIEAKDAEIEKLQRERNGWENSATTEAEDRKAAKDRADAAEARVKELEKEQKPTGYHDVDEFYQDDPQPTPEDRITALESELAEAQERTGLGGTLVEAIDHMRKTISSIAALEQELAAAEARVKDYQDACIQKQEIINSHAVVEAHYRDDIAGRDTVILRLESELATLKEINLSREDALQATMLRADKAGLELAEAKKDTARLDLLKKWGNVAFSWTVVDLRESIDRAERNMAVIGAAIDDAREE